MNRAIPSFFLAVFAASCLLAFDLMLAIAGPLQGQELKENNSVVAVDVTVVMNDDSVIEGKMISKDADRITVVTKRRLRRLKISDIKTIYDTHTGKMLDLSTAHEEQEEPKEANERWAEGTRANQTEKSEAEGTQKLESSYEIYAFATLRNSYNVGDGLKTWMHDDVASGSPVFYNIGGAWFMGVNPQKTIFLGMGLSLNIPVSHSIWGSNLFYGGRTEIVLEPYIMCLDMSFRYIFGNSGMSLTLTPGFLVAFVPGHYDGDILVDGTIYSTLDSRSYGGMGFGLNAGVEYFLAKHFGLGMKLGSRILKPDLILAVPGTQNTFSIDDSEGNPMKLDLGGTYMTIGALIKF